MRLLRPILFVALLAALRMFPSASHAATFNVGPGQPLVAIGDVPWHTLAAGDEVRIHWRAEPYREKWVIGRRGTEANPIVVRGIPSPNGERPIISGENAVTPAPLNFWNEERGVIKIGGSNTPSNTLPAWIVIEGLEIRSGHPDYTFTDDGGTVRSYNDNAASIYVEKAEHLVIRDCLITDSGNGIFIGAFDGETQDILIDRNEIRGNGVVGSIFVHNTYTAAIGIVYQGNRFGALKPGAGGNNLKDRSAGLVVRYNWIEDGNRQLDLVDAEDSQVLVNHPSYDETHVYGNVLIEGDGEGNSQIVHYGGDSGTTSDYRKGTLYFHNNTVISTRSGNTTLMRLSTNDESADVRNNILYVTASGNRLAMLSSAGTLDLSHNWTKAGWVGSHGGVTGTLNDDGTGLTGASPGFVDELSQNFELTETSTCRDAGTVLNPAILPAHTLDRQYRPHQTTVPRFDDGFLDLGAFEFCIGGAGPCDVVFDDGFETGSFGEWSSVTP